MPLFVTVLNVCSVSEHFTSHAMFIMPLFTIVLDCVCSVSEHFTSHAMFIMPRVSAEEQYIYHFSLLDLICVQLFRPDSCPLFVPFIEVKSGLGEEKKKKARESTTCVTKPIPSAKPNIQTKKLFFFF